MRIYLSGPIEYAEDNGVGWREYTKTQIVDKRFQLVDPCDSSLVLLANHGIETVDHYHKLKYGSEQDQKRFREATQSMISHDLEEVRKADLLLAKISSVASGGTSGEITLAKFLNVPVIAFCQSDVQEVSGWVQSVPDVLFTGEKSVDEAIEYIKSEDFIHGFANRHWTQEETRQGYSS